MREPPITSDRFLNLASKIWPLMFGGFFIVFGISQLLQVNDTNELGTNDQYLGLFLAFVLGLACLAQLFNSFLNECNAELTGKEIKLLRGDHLLKTYNWNELKNAKFVWRPSGRMIKLDFKDGFTKLIYPDRPPMTFRTKFEPHDHKMWRLIQSKTRKKKAYNN